MDEKYKKLNMSKLNNRKHKIVSAIETLKEITPIQWSEEVLNGTMKVQIDKQGIREVCVK